MTDKQIQIADEFLKYMVENGGYSTEDGYPSLLEERGHPDNEYNLVYMRMQDADMIEFISAKQITRLKDEGYFAEKMGYAKYLDYQYEKRIRKDSRKINEYKSSKVQKYLYPLSLIYSSVTILWAIIKYAPVLFHKVQELMY